MFKLVFLTLAVLAAAMFFLGGGEGRRVDPTQKSRAAPSAAPAAPTPIPATPPAQAQLRTTPTPGLTAAAETPAVPMRRREFPGPALMPSPEYAGQTPAAAAPAEVPAATAAEETLFVTGNSVNFRAGPTTSDAVVGTLSRGDIVTPLGPPSGDWIEIRDESGRDGFVAARFLSAAQP